MRRNCHHAASPRFKSGKCDMKQTITESRQIGVKDSFDVIVAGGGIAGISAALSAKRMGMRVLVVEKGAMLGGLATLGLVNWYEPLCDGQGNVLVKGIAEELIKLSVRYGYHNLPEQWKQDGDILSPGKRYATFFNPSVFALALNGLMMDEGIEVRYDMIASYPLMEDKLCKGLIVESKSGRELFPCEVIIDATGDADIIFRAGIPCRLGENYLTYYGHGCTQKSMKKALDTGDMYYLNDRVFGIGADMNGKGHPESMPYIKGIGNEIISDYLKTGQKMLFEKMKDEPQDSRCLYTLPNITQMRKTRSMVGDETFVGIDGLRAGNSIGATGDFREKGKHFELPMGVLYNSEFPNILAAGRDISAEGDGWEISRVIPVAALTGQAAGTLAALAVSCDEKATKISYEILQSALIRNGVNLHY